ncbi:hypothetical protein CGRA01v4_05210 [Colletotrichum graminicola]|nr:hypothetical protein CGRA01v4_05210 [Colletotrichum graminicola]
MTQGLRKKMCSRENYDIQNNTAVNFKHTYPINPSEANIIKTLSGWAYPMTSFQSFCIQPYPMLKLNNHITSPGGSNLGMAAYLTQSCFVYWSVDRQVNSTLHGRNHRQVIHHKIFPYGEGSFGLPESCWMAGFFAINTLSAC